MIEGFRLPNGAFAGTQIGTDIIILKKQSENIQ
jgi:type I restriction-modification system DNA methylase subunit